MLNVVQSLRHNASVEKALANMRAMGLQVSCLPESDDEVFVFINLESLCKLVSRRIPYPQKEVKIELPFMVVRMWRG